MAGFAYDVLLYRNKELSIRYEREASGDLSDILKKMVRIGLVMLTLGILKWVMAFW